MENNPVKKIQFIGEVVETFDEQGKRAVKIHVESHFVDVFLEDNDEVYLGDKVVIDAEIAIKKVTLSVPVNRGEPA